MLTLELKRKMLNLKHRHHRQIADKLEYLRAMQWADPERFWKERDGRLAHLLQFAQRNVPYYSDMRQMNDIVVANGRIDYERFAQIPLMDKSILQQQYKQLLSDDLDTRDWTVNTSGGSTGVPARFAQDQIYKDWSQGNKMLFDEWSGRAVGDKQIRLWGSVRDLLVGKETWRTYTGRWLRGEVWLNAYEMSEKLMSDYVQIINRFKPKQILSYVESIYELARFIQKKGLKVHAPGGIMTTAGVLRAEMRETIESTFRTKVFNRYGSREVGDMACECDRHEGLHVSELMHYVELVDDEGKPVAPGEAGHIVVTSLSNYAMPLIRYRIGDMAVWSEQPCSCGRPHRLLKEIFGRESDSFITSNGTRIHGSLFTQLLFSLDWVERYQVVQEDVDRIVITIVSEGGERDLAANRKMLDQVVNDIRKSMGEECDVDFKTVAHIDTSASGKYRYTISKVAL
ncbi:phenylacetate--CoA ligase family protein [Paenibacillus sp. R14(2021)]|uniref:phenylacetate--CoA ligase family protein n=1 Tax=Paenibacillus sp. R14(2021) TaxID=2859228 RepID=UPI001C61630A|nr:hypothetical protein [Paenibacillus sp. R14(2021)]